MPTAQTPLGDLLLARVQLLQLAGSKTLPSELQPYLRAAGLVDERGILHERLLPALRSVAKPVLTLDVVEYGRGIRRAARIWTAERTVLHPEAGDASPRPLISVGRALLPVLLARCLHLHPRSVERVPAFEATPDELLEVPAGVPVVQAPRLRQLCWESEGKSAGLSVLDLRERGLWKPTRRIGDRFVWEPTNVPDIWTELAPLFAVALPTSRVRLPSAGRQSSATSISELRNHEGQGRLEL